MAFCQPWSARARTYGSVALLSACAELRATAPGMLVTQSCVTPCFTYTGSACVVGWLVSKQPPWSIAMPTTTEPRRMRRITAPATTPGASAPSTRTESEQAFQAGFVSMYGNLPFVLRLVGLAIVFGILLIAANTMMTSMRERTGEFAVLKSLGFTDGAVFTMVVAEAAVITVGGGAIGALAAKFSIEKSGFNFMGFLPPMSVYWSTVFIGIGIALFVGMISGLLPALRASRLRIVDALRTVD